MRGSQYIIVSMLFVNLMEANISHSCAAYFHRHFSLNSVSFTATLFCLAARDLHTSLYAQSVVRPPPHNILVDGPDLGFTAILLFFFFFFYLLLSSFFVSYPPSSLNGTQPKPATCSEVGAV